MPSTAVIKIVVRRDTLAEWTSANPVLLQGEIGFITDANLFVIGDGVKTFTQLYDANPLTVSPNLFLNESYIVQNLLQPLSTNLTTLINNEATSRSNADATLQLNIDNEAIARGSADTTLQTNINNEETARITADGNLQTNIDTVQSNVVNLEANVLNWYGTAVDDGDILAFDTDNQSFLVLPIGNNGDVLQADNTEPLGLKWTAPTVGGDMFKTTYDTNNDGVVNASDVAYEVDWADVTNKPTIGVGDMEKSVYDTDNDGVVDSAERTQILVRNSTGVQLNKGEVVYLSGATGNRPNAVLADASTEATSSKTIGIVYENILNNADGYVVTNGTLHNLDTSLFNAGDTLWLSETAGQMQANTPPSEPAHAVFIGYVARAHPTLGRVILAIQNGYELNELHGVLINSVTNNDVLYYQSSTGLWKNGLISTVLGYTPADASALSNYELVITLGTTAQYWRGDKTWQTLDKNAVGLSNVDNTSDANKPISTATQTAINSKQDTLVSGTNIKTIEGVSLLGSGNIDLSKADVGLSNVDNTSDANKPISTATQTALNGKEPSITSGTVADYWRGDKSWQTLNKTAVGLSNVDNTSDANKPISTATQTALNGKENTITVGTTAQYYRGDKTFQTLDKSAVGLGNVDNTSDANKPISTATQTALNGKEPTITAGTVTDYWRGDKTWQTLDKSAVGLGNVDNTSDANKPISTATQTALNGKQNSITLTTTGTSGPATLIGSTLNVPQYAGGGGGISASDSIAYAIALG